MKILKSYNNGNYNVKIYDDGTKIRFTEEDEFKPIFPESMDIKITNFCNMNCDFCLIGQTVIKTPLGGSYIANMKINDEVHCYDIKNNKQTTSIVKKIYKRKYSGELIVIENNNKKIKLTPNHKVFTVNRGYIRADKLKNNDELLDF